MKIVILGSGRGSNAEAVLTEYTNGNLGNAQPVAIFSDQQQALILKLGEKFDIPAVYLNPGNFKTKLSEAAEENYIEIISGCKPDLIVLAGYMRMVHRKFLDAFPNKIINLHPSLLPSFKGLNSIKRAFEYGVKYTGCTVHYVNEQMDAGKIIDQKIVPIESDDTLESLEEKIHKAEHQLLPEVIRRLSGVSADNL